MGFPYNELLTENLVPLAWLAPASQTAATHKVPLSGGINMNQVRRVLFVIEVGALGSSATVDFAIQSSLTAAGSYTSITGTSITQITSGSTNMALVEMKAEALNQSGVSNPYIQGLLTIGVAATLASVTLWGAVNRYNPYASTAIAALVQTVVL